MFRISSLTTCWSSLRAAAWPAPRVLDGLWRIAVRGDAVAATLIALVTAMMVLPLPSLVIDALIGVNLAAAVLLIALALYLPSAVSFSSFPVVLLLTTLFRLGIEVSTSRSILLHADAGEIVDTFGRFVTGENMAVGLIVFAIIAIVQFLVVTKGAERVAEVAARFTLDAMPGRQMAIDADLRAGFTRPETAQLLRADLARESRMHGAMDGAMRFVKGDAIAGLIIVFVNLTAGMAIGVAQHGLTFEEALSRYSILTIGNALVAQIPALLIAIAAAVLITRGGESTGKGSTVGEQIARQLSGAPAAWLMAACVMVIFAAAPGMPWVVFVLLGGAMLGIGIARMRRDRRDQARSQAGPQIPSLDAVPDDADVRQIVPMRPIVVSLSSRAPDGDTGEASELAGRTATLERTIRRVRNELVLRYGVTVPVIEIDRVKRLEPYAYEIAIHEVVVAAGAFQAEVAVGPGSDAMGDFAELLRRLLHRHAGQFVGMQEAQLVFNWLQREMPAVAKELSQALTLSRFAEVMKLLVVERVALRNVREIAETLVAWAPKEKDAVPLTERVRTALGAQICQEFACDGVLQVWLLDRELEERLGEALQQTPVGPVLAIDHDATQRFIERIRAQGMATASRTASPVLLTTQALRRPLRQLLAGEFFETHVVSYAELVPTQRVNVLGNIALAEGVEGTS